MQETQEMLVWSLGQEDPLEEGMATDSSVLAWRIQWTEKPDKHVLSPVINSNSNSGKSRWNDVPLMCCDENGAFLCLPFPQKLQPQSNHEKDIKQTQIDGHSTKYLTSTP